MSDLCIACGKLFGGRQHVVICDVCGRWQHRLCGNVVEKPPVPIRPSSGKFHNRGSLFPSTYHNQLFQMEMKNEQTEADANTENNCRELVLYPSASKDDADLNVSKSRKIPNYCKRTQSAKARQRTKPPVPVSRRPRPQSASYTRDLKKLKPTRNTNTTSSNDSEGVEPNQVAVVDLANDITPDLFNIQRENLLALPDPRNYSYNATDLHPMSFSRPSSATYSHGQGEKCGCKSDILSKKVERWLKPSVYGLQRQKHVYGSAPNLTCQNSESFPYKLSKTENDRSTNFRLEDKVEGKLSNLPTTLEPLWPWLISSVPQEVIGADPAKCLIFLPSMDYSCLPEVPEPNTVEDDLPFYEDVTTPKPWNPKKYPHPFNKQPVEEWVCKHSSHTATTEENLKWTTVYKKFKLPRMRTADVIKKEISDLENLLKGIGTQQSDCAMVRYQDDLTTLQDMLQVTMEKIPDRLKTPAPEPPDRFGLNKVFKDHDSIIEEIQQRVEECRLELAELELEAGIESERQYFRKRSNSTL